MTRDSKSFQAREAQRSAPAGPREAGAQSSVETSGQRAARRAVR